MTTVRLVLSLGVYATGGIVRGVIDDDWNSPKIQWGRRVSGFYLPDRRLNMYTWLPERAPVGIASIEPNQPETGDTRVTLAQPGRAGFPLFRSVGDVIRLTFSGTGVANLDGRDHFDAEVLVAGNATTNPVLALRGVVASSSATAGIAFLGLLFRYGEDTGLTDATYGGTFPSEQSGMEYRMLQLIQDAIGVGEQEDDPIVWVPLFTASEGLRARGQEGRARWLAELEGQCGLSDGSLLPIGAKLSVFADLRSLIADVKAGLIGTLGVTEDDFVVTGVVMGFGLNEGRVADVGAGRNIRAIASFALDGDDLLVTTTAAHGVPDHVNGTAWQVAKVSGLTTDPDGVSGPLREVERVTDTQLRIREFTASEVPTFSAGAATIEHGDPGYWFLDDMLAQIDATRALLAEQFPENAADEIPTVLLVPDYKTSNAVDASIRAALLSIPGRRDALTTHDLAGLDRQSNALYDIEQTWAQAPVTILRTAGGWLLSHPLGGLSELRVLSVLQLYFEGESGFSYAAVAQIVSDTVVVLANINNPASPHDGLVPIDGAFPGLPLVNRTTNALMWRIVHDEAERLYSLPGVLALGEAVAPKLLNPVAPAIANARSPAICIGYIAHSYGVGKAATTFILDGDPDLLSTDADPHVGQRIWNPSTEAWEDVRLGLSSSGAIECNYNRHPEWNWAQLFPGAEAVGGQPALMHGARERFPDETVHLLNLAVGGATLGIATANRVPRDVTRAIILPGFLLLELSGFSGEALVQRDLYVEVNGVTGLTPDPNGTHADARLQFISGSAKQWIAIPGDYAGTPNVASATLGIRRASWHPAAAELFDSWAVQATQAFEALWSAGRIPDFRALFVDLGANDAASDTADGFGDALAAFVPAIRNTVRTLGLPRQWDVPIVWLAPPIHDGLDATRLAYTQTIRSALAAYAANDPAFVVLSIDENEDWLLDPSPISSDEVHPTFVGYRERGYRAARQGLALVSGFDTLAPADFTPNTPVGDVTP